MESDVTAAAEDDSQSMMLSAPGETKSLLDEFETALQKRGKDDADDADGCDADSSAAATDSAEAAGENTENANPNANRVALEALSPNTRTAVKKESKTLGKNSKASRGVNKDKVNPKAAKKSAPKRRAFQDSDDDDENVHAYDSSDDEEIAFEPKKKTAARGGGGRKARA
jgi:hypothetical protein